LTKFQTDAVALVALTEAKALIICFIGRDKIGVQYAPFL
jgi:hypothetical protein